jgi:hypothetical protein
MGHIAHLSNLGLYKDFSHKYEIHFLLPHLTTGGHSFSNLAFGLCQKVFMSLSAFLDQWFLRRFEEEHNKADHPVAAGNANNMCPK